MARILWIPSAQPGSLYPAVPIALELVRREHAMTVLCAARSQAAFDSLGLEFRPARQLAAVEAPSREHGRAGKLAWHARYVRALYADTRSELATGAFDAVMVDPLEPGADFAAEAAGIPSFSYVHWRPNERGADIPFCLHFWNGAGSAAAAFVDWWNEQRAVFGLAPEPRPANEHLWYRHSRGLTLILGFPELVEPKGVLPRYAVRVGPTVWEPPLPGPLPQWVEQLGRERPAVLASVSTVGAADAQLAAAVGQAVAGENIDVVLTVAADGTLPPLPANVRTMPFLSHGALLPHVSAVVSHAGNGTVTRAACAGVPLLLLPGGRDQPEVARGAAAAGIALVLDRERSDAARVRSALRTLLQDTRYLVRARALARRAEHYDAPATAADAIEALLAFRLGDQATAAYAAHLAESATTS